MAVTANQTIARAAGCRGSGPVEESTHIYEGTLCFVNAAGYIDDDTASGVNEFAGIAIEEYDNSSGADGDISAEFWQDGEFELTGSGFAQTSVGLEVYATDNYTLTLTAAGGVYIGKITRYISSTKVAVKIDTSASKTTTLDSLTVTKALSGGVGTVAAAGTNQGTAGAITTASLIWVVTGGNDTTGVVLPAAVAGIILVILNSGSAGLKIYPASGDKINNGSGDANITILENTMAIFACTAADNWAASFTANS